MRLLQGSEKVINDWWGDYSDAGSRIFESGTGGAVYKV